MKKLLSIFIITAIFAACSDNNNNENRTDSMHTGPTEGNSDATMQQPIDSTNHMNDSTHLMDTTQLTDSAGKLRK